MGLKTSAKLTSWISPFENGRRPSYMKVREIFIKLKAEGSKDIDFYSQSWNLMSVKINVKNVTTSPYWKTEGVKGMINKSGWLWRAYLHMHRYVYILYMTSYTRQTCPSQVWWTTFWSPLAPGPLQEASSPLKGSLVISLPWGKAH